ncbi:MAG: ORF6N domain-containing protein [Candidatus Deferrimicrobiaceae bacterium]
MPGEPLGQVFEHPDLERLVVGEDLGPFRDVVHPDVPLPVEPPLVYSPALEIEDRALGDAHNAISKPGRQTEEIARRILTIRGQRVMLDADLADLYGVTTKSLNQAVKRNATRFPEDFTFRLTTDEAANLKSQFVTSSGWGGRRRSLPLAFTDLVRNPGRPS